jgi:hypothetical protein
MQWTHVWGSQRVEKKLGFFAIWMGESILRCGGSHLKIQILFLDKIKGTFPQMCSISHILIDPKDLPRVLSLWCS